LVSKLGKSRRVRQHELDELDEVDVSSWEVRGVQKEIRCPLEDVTPFVLLYHGKI
jgi:hypothetical protein